MTNLVFSYINLGLASGVLLGIVWLLQPVTRRLLTPRQRVILWIVTWLNSYMPNLYLGFSLIRVFPLTIRDMITPRTFTVYELPGYLPYVYSSAPGYNLAGPGGFYVPVTLSDGLCLAVILIWLAGLVTVVWHLSRGGKRAIQRAMEQGQRLERDHPYYGMIGWEGEIWLCEGLPTSFVTKEGEEKKWLIFLQKELSSQRMELVLRHEANHKALGHCNMKVFPTAGICMHWWNPMMWLAYFATCRDMELDCDAHTMKELDSRDRREYARTLLELGCGRQLWDAPMCFGECDAQVRVKEAAQWRAAKKGTQLLGWCLTVVLALTLMGGPMEVYLAADVLPAWEQHVAVKADNLLSETKWAAGEVSGRKEVEQIWIPSDMEPGGMCLLPDGSWWEMDIRVVQYKDGRFLFFPDLIPHESVPDLSGYTQIY